MLPMVSGNGRGVAELVREVAEKFGSGISSNTWRASGVAEDLGRCRGVIGVCRWFPRSVPRMSDGSRERVADRVAGHGSGSCLGLGLLGSDFLGWTIRILFFLF